MRKIIILLSLFVIAGFLDAQNPVYEYSYDAAGNRIRRAVVTLHKDGKGLAGDKEADPESGMTLFQAGVRVYPNPTQGTVTVEAADNLAIGSYRLLDGKGVHLEDGRCGSNTLTLDLSKRADGVYLLDAWFGTERRHFKIVKR